MPKNKGKGGKNRRRGKNEGDKAPTEIYRITLEENPDESWEEYGQVISAVGGGNFRVRCYIHKSMIIPEHLPENAMPEKEDFYVRDRLCGLAGSMRKKVWIQAGDLVTVGIQEFEPHKGQIIYKYNADQAAVVKAEYKDVPSYLKTTAVDNDGPGGEGEDDHVQFAKPADDEEESDEDDKKKAVDIDDI